MSFFYSIPAGIAGSILNTVSSLRAAKIAEDQAEVEATYRELEAQNAENAAALEAANIRAASEYNEAQARKRLQYIISTNRAIGATSGVDISSGSPMMAQIENVKQAEMEALNIRRGGEMAANIRLYEGQLQAQERYFLGTQARYQAKLIKEQRPYTIAAGVTLATGYAAQGYMQYNRTPTASAPSASTQNVAQTESVLQSWGSTSPYSGDYGGGSEFGGDYDYGYF